MKRNLTTARVPPCKTPLLVRLVKWTAWAVLALDAATALLYAAASYRGAEDQSLLGLARFCLLVSLLLVSAAFYGIVLDLFYAIRMKRAAFLAGVLGYLVIAALGVVTALASAFIAASAGGNR